MLVINRMASRFRPLNLQKIVPRFYPRQLVVPFRQVIQSPTVRRFQPIQSVISHKLTLKYPFNLYRPPFKHNFNEKKSSKQATDDKVVIVTFAVLLINVGVYCMYCLCKNFKEFTWMRENSTCSLKNLKEGRLHTLVTQSISHDNALHLVMNCLGILSFSPPIIEKLGVKRYMIFYLVGGLSGSLLHIWHENIYRPKQLKSVGTDTPAIGASGSICSLLMMYTIMFPRDKLYVLFVIPVQARLFVPILVIGSTYCFLKPGSNDRVSHAGHLGGAVFGLMYSLLLLRRGKIVRG